jgi:hypothetical protein
MIDGAISRRGLIQAGAAATAVALAGRSPASWAKPPRSWPDRSLPASAAQQVVSSQFISTRQLEAWGGEADRVGLRATGSEAHEAYVRKLAHRLRRAGLEGVRREPVPMRQWLAKSWSVTVNGQKMKNTYYAPYTKQTPRGGITAPMVYVGSGLDLSGVDLHGKIAVFDVSYTEVTLGTWQAISYADAFRIASDDPRSPDTVYARPWFNSNASVLEALANAGAVATIGIWTDLPGKWARQYTPYDGVFRQIPGLWIDSHGGARLRQLAGNGASATVELDARVRNVKTHNVVGYIPGRSKELTVLHTHTDGTNGMEENGQLPILAVAQYLARLPKSARDRTIMVMLSSGHFYGGVGIRHFLDAHRDDLVPRISSLLTLEHVGCTEWLPGDGGKPKPTGLPEYSGTFAPDSRGLVDALIAAESRYRISGTVGRPFTDPPPGAVEPVSWPGEGSYFWALGSLLDGNYITGPYGLITADLDTTGMVDYKLMRRQAKASVKTVLQLASASSEDLAAPASA